MNIWRPVAFALVVSSLLAGCNKPAAAPAAPATPTTPPPASSAAPANNFGYPTAAQPRLKTVKLWLGAEEMLTEIARNGKEVQTGMMFRTNMAENEGMLFVFPYPHQTSFWMKNTKVPLSAAYISPDGVILEIHKLEPENTNSVVAATDQVQFVLETPQGWFERHNVSTGALIRAESGSLKESFLQQQRSQ